MKKNHKKSDDLEILNCGEKEKQTKPNLWDTSSRVGVQLVFAPCRRYVLYGGTFL